MRAELRKQGGVEDADRGLSQKQAATEQVEVIQGCKEACGMRRKIICSLKAICSTVISLFAGSGHPCCCMLMTIVISRS